MSAVTATTTTALSRLGATILGWLVAQPKGEGNRSELGDALKPLLDPRWSDAERGRAIDDELKVLERAESIARPRQGALKIIRRDRIVGPAARGVSAFPKKSDWQGVKKRTLCARALEVDPFPLRDGSKRSNDTDRLRAAIVAHDYRLKIVDAPTLNKVRDAIAWREIGVENGEPFTLVAVRRVLLNRALGAVEPRGDRTVLLADKKVLEHLAARAVGVGPADWNGLPTAVLRRWLTVEALMPRIEPPAVPQMPLNPDRPPPVGASLPLPPPLIQPGDDGAFAARVLAAAQATKTGRFGDDKVFISHVFRRLVSEGAVARDPESFKSRLVSALRQGLLRLSRADMVEAMAAEDVDASETRNGSATFHFVRI